MHVCQTACHAGSSLSQLHCRPIASCSCCLVVAAPAIPAACHKPLTAKCFRTPKHSAGGFVGSRCCMWLPAGVAAVGLLHLLCCSQSTAGLCRAAAPRELSQIQVSFARTGGRPGSRAARMCCGRSGSGLPYSVVRNPQHCQWENWELKQTACCIYVTSQKLR